jgi:hypothetical protein
MNNWLHDAGYNQNNNGQYCKEFLANNEVYRKITIIIVQSNWASTLIELDETAQFGSVKNITYSNRDELMNNYIPI